MTKKKIRPVDMRMVCMSLSIILKDLENLYVCAEDVGVPDEVLDRLRQAGTTLDTVYAASCEFLREST